MLTSFHGLRNYWELKGEQGQPGPPPRPTRSFRYMEQGHMQEFPGFNGLQDKRGLATPPPPSPGLPEARESDAHAMTGKITTKRVGGVTALPPQQPAREGRHKNKSNLGVPPYNRSLLGPCFRLVRVKHRGVGGANRPRVGQTLAVGGQQDLPVGLEPHRVDADEAARVRRLVPIHIFHR